jgi:peptide/nickel transport system permease protein
MGNETTGQSISLTTQEGIERAPEEEQEEPAPRSLTRQRLEMTLREPTVVVGAVIVIFWIAMAVLGTLVRPFSYSEMAGVPWQAPSKEFWLGTDRMGRDMFTRIAVGARLMLVLPTVGITIGAVLGSTVGLIVGYYGGMIDNVIMRVMDILMAFPMLMLYLLVIFAIGPSAINVIWAIAIGATPGVARLVRGLTMEARNKEFVLAAQMRGESSLYVVFREILPNITGPIIVDACIRVAFAMFATGSLGYLGLGVPPPYPDWGAMISEGRSWIFQFPWAPVPPIIAISSLVIALNLIADGLRKVGWVD